jgi:2-C-methyl-D-erythritol 4-phosphate cytidylyltransferase
MNAPKTYAVLVAGGSGSRMQTDIPKQFLSLKGKPLLAWSIEAFLKAIPDISIILVLPEAHLETGRQITNTYFPNSLIILTSGGDTRFQSVKNGLQLIPEDGIVMVHDAVRCLVSVSLIQNSIKEVMVKKAVVPTVAATDSIRIAKGDKNETMPRDSVRLVQTPQTFFSNTLKKAFEQQYQPHFTDEAAVMEAAGHSIHLIEGDIRNIKVTHPIDLYLAEKLLEQ